MGKKPVLALVGGLWVGLALSGTVGCEHTGGSKFSGDHRPLFGTSSADKNKTDTVVTQGVGQPGNPTVMGSGTPNAMSPGIGQPTGMMQQPSTTGTWTPPPTSNVGQMQMNTGRGVAQPLPVGSQPLTPGGAPVGNIQQPTSTGVPVSSNVTTPPAVIIPTSGAQPQLTGNVAPAGGFTQAQPLPSSTRFGTPNYGDESGYGYPGAARPSSVPGAGLRGTDPVDNGGARPTIPPPPPTPSNSSPVVQTLSTAGPTQQPINGAPPQPTPVGDSSPAPVNMPLGTGTGPAPVNGLGPR
jgi:hypothetical protein